MKKNYFLLSVSLLCLIYSCRKKTIDPGLEFYVFSYISPQQPSTMVSVSLIHPLSDGRLTNPTSIKTEGNATVIVSDKLHAYTLDYDEKSGQYVIDSSKLKIIPGDTYKLSITLPNGKKTTAETTIPFANTSFNAKIDSSALNVYMVNASWRDEDPTSNVYLLGFNSGKQADWILIGSDKYNPNGTLTASLQPSSFPSKHDTIVVALSVCAKEFGMYHQLYLDTHRIFGDGNLSSGYGVFSGYNSSFIQIVPK